MWMDGWHHSTLKVLSFCFFSGPLLNFSAKDNLTLNKVPWNSPVYFLSANIIPLKKPLSVTVKQLMQDKATLILQMDVMPATLCCFCCPGDCSYVQGNPGCLGKLGFQCLHASHRLQQLKQVFTSLAWEMVLPPVWATVTKNSFWFDRNSQSFNMAHLFVFLPPLKHTQYTVHFYLNGQGKFWGCLC